MLPRDPSSNAHAASRVGRSSIEPLDTMTPLSFDARKTTICSASPEYGDIGVMGYDDYLPSFLGSPQDRNDALINELAVKVCPPAGR